MLHLDLDAFFASVEQRDKPSLRGKPVVVGGLGQRGVVATASYEARVFGVRSAMPTHEARRRCPHAAFLAGRFGAYRIASRQVMDVLHRLAPVVEPLSLDEAFVDLRAAARTSAARAGVADQAAQGRGSRDHERSTASWASRRRVCRQGASELAKPDGSHRRSRPRAEFLRPIKVAVIPASARYSAEAAPDRHPTVSDSQACALDEWLRWIGKTPRRAARAGIRRDDRPVEPDRRRIDLVRGHLRKRSGISARARHDLARDAGQVRAGCAPQDCSPARCRSRFGCMTSRPSQDHARYLVQRIAQMSSARSQRGCCRRSTPPEEFGSSASVSPA